MLDYLLIKFFTKLDSIISPKLDDMRLEAFERLTKLGFDPFNVDVFIKVIVPNVLLGLIVILMAIMWSEGKIIYPAESFEADDIDETTEGQFFEEEREECDLPLPLDSAESYYLYILGDELLWEEWCEQEYSDWLEPAMEYDLFTHYEGELYSKYDFNKERYYLFDDVYWEKKRKFEKKRKKIINKYTKLCFEKGLEEVKKAEEVKEIEKSKLKKLINFFNLKKKKKV